MSMRLNESIIENAGVTWFGELGYAVGHGPQIPPGQSAALMYKASCGRTQSFCSCQPKLPSSVSCMESSETMIEEVS